MINDDDLTEIKKSISIVEMARLYGAEPIKEHGDGVGTRHNPLRDEKSSSLKLYSSSNSYNDFGSGSGGSIIDFVMQAESMTLSEAIKKIKDMAGIMPKAKPAYAVEPKSFMAPNIVMKIWDQQPAINFDNGNKELLSIAPKWCYDEADSDDLAQFHAIVRLEKQSKAAFILLKDDDIARTIRYRRYKYTDRDSGYVVEKKWFALAGTQSNFIYKRIKNTNDIVLIVEGTHDYITAILCGYNVIALPSAGAKIPPELLKNRICVFMDDDDGKNFMRPEFEKAECSKIWFDHAEFKKKNKIKAAKDFSDYLECFKDMKSFREAMELAFDLIVHSSYTSNENRLLCFSGLIDNITPPTWMVKGMIPEDGLLEFVGASGSYKSFLIIDMMFCISAGIDYHGLPTKKGTCVYVAGEGKNGAIVRVRALSIKYGVTPDNFYILPMPSNLMDSSEMDLLASDIKAISPDDSVSMVIFDTLHRNSAGSKENSADDFAVMLGNMDKFIKPKSKTVGYVHHTGKGEGSKKDGRGTSARFGAVDTSIFIGSDEKNTAYMENSKQKDGEAFARIGFFLHTISVGVLNEDGDDVLSLYPEMNSEALKSIKDDGNSNKDDIDYSIMKDDIFDFICENDGCVRSDIIGIFKGAYSRRKVEACLKDFKDIHWRYSKGEKNSFPLHAIHPTNKEPIIIEYNVDSMMDGGLF